MDIRFRMRHILRASSLADMSHRSCVATSHVSAALAVRRSPTGGATILKTGDKYTNGQSEKKILTLNLKPVCGVHENEYTYNERISTTMHCCCYVYKHIR